MTYAKLVNSNLIFPPVPLLLNGHAIINPSDEQLRSAGYFPVIYTDRPETAENETAAPAWEERSDGIYQVWTVSKFVPEPTLEDRLAAAESAILVLMGGMPSV